MKPYHLSVAALGAAFLLTACLPVAQAVSAAELGVRLAKAVRSAQASAPDDLEARLVAYGRLYCDLRDDYALQWAEVRQAALRAGAPEAVIARVKGHIDAACGI